MKQKIVISVPVNSKKPFFGCFSCFCDDEGGSKPFQIAAGFSGVETAGYVANNKNKIEVTGDGVDAVELTSLLQKKVGYAALESVTEVKAGGDDGGKKGGNDGDKKGGDAAALLPPPPPPFWQYGCRCPYHPYAFCTCY